MAERGIGPAAQDQIVKSITSFALYGFPESHAASFALIAYASAYLKAHHPAAFYAALLNAWPMGFYHPGHARQGRAAPRDAKCWPVDVTRSGWKCRWEKEGVRLGMRFVKGLKQETGEAIERAQAAPPFSSIDDLARRCRLRDDELELLAHAGALASFGRTRRAALWQVAKVAREAGPALRGDPDGRSVAAARDVADRGDPRRLRDDRDHDGAAHAGAPPQAALAPRRAVGPRSSRASGTATASTTAGAVIVRQRPGTAKGFVFLTLEDETGMLQAIVRPDLFREQRAVVVGSGALVVKGKLQRQDGSLSVRAERFWTIPEFARMPSHDFR